MGKVDQIVDRKVGLAAGYFACPPVGGEGVPQVTIGSSAGKDITQFYREAVIQSIEAMTVTRRPEASVRGSHRRCGLFGCPQRQYLDKAGL